MLTQSLNDIEVVPPTILQQTNLYIQSLIIHVLFLRLWVRALQKTLFSSYQLPTPDPDFNP